MKTLAIIFLFIGGVALLVGLVSLPNSRMGVGGIGVAGFFGILGRLALVSGHRGDVPKMVAGETVLPRSGRTNPVSGFAALLAPDQTQCANCGRVAKRGPAECSQCRTAYT